MHDEYEDLAALHSVGAASPEEIRQLERHLSECANCREANLGFAAVAGMLPLALDPVMPPPAVRDALLSRAQTTTPATRTPRTRGRTILALAASLALVALLAGWAAYRLGQEREEAVRLRAHLEAVNRDRDRLEQQHRRAIADIQALSGASQVTPLVGQQVAPEASARVFLLPESRRAYVFFESLPVAPPDKDYQLWIIRADQANPESAGVFKVGPSGRAVLKVENLPVETTIRGLAVTLEPEGGVPAPTGELYLGSS